MRRVGPVVALALAAAACGPGAPPASAPSTPVRIDADASGPVDAASVPKAILDTWHETARDRRALGGPVGVRAGALRLTARLHALPAALEVPVPRGARALRFRVSLGAADPRCAAGLRARWGPVAQETSLTPGDWRVVLLEGDAPEATPLTLELEGRGCRAWAALSEIRPSVRATSPATRPDLLLVVLDTVRRDHLDCDEVIAELMPNVYRDWCRRGLFLEDAWSTTSWTYPAVASMLTGLRPTQHGAFRPRGQRLELV